MSLVWVGLNSNARKNRSGKAIKEFIARQFTENGIEFAQQVHRSRFKELSSINKDTKRFDFAIVTPLKIYLIEVNFYSSGGSKLNETARSYIEVANEVNKVPGV